MEQMDCFIFYFDVIGVVNRYLSNPSVKDDIEAWQSAVRHAFTFGHQQTTCKAMFDNVWARITSQHPESDIYEVLDFAGETMRLAKQFGFENYFGAITYGTHSFDQVDRTLV